jgi:hypothetical protein
VSCGQGLSRRWRGCVDLGGPLWVSGVEHGDGVGDDTRGLRWVSSALRLARDLGTTNPAGANCSSVKAWGPKRRVAAASGQKVSRCQFLTYRPSAGWRTRS